MENYSTPLTDFYDSLTSVPSESVLNNTGTDPNTWNDFLAKQSPLVHPESNMLQQLFNEGGLGKFHFARPAFAEAAQGTGDAVHLTPQQAAENRALLDRYKGVNFNRQVSKDGITHTLTKGNRTLASLFDNHDNQDFIKLVRMGVLSGVGSVAGGAALGAMGGGGGAAAGTGIGTAGAGATAGAAATPSLWSTIGSGALRGAVGGAVSSGLGGGNILQGALTGGLSGGLGGGMGSLNPAGMMGIENEFLRGAVNRGVGNLANTALRGGNLGDSLKSSVISGGLNFGGNQLANLFNQGGSGNMDYSLTSASNWNGFGDQGASSTGNYNPGTYDLGTNFQGFGDLGGYGYQNSGNYGLGSSPNMGYSGGGGQGGSNPLMGFFRNMVAGPDGKVSGQKIGDMAGSLLGMYQANRARRDAKSQINNLQGMFGQNSAAAQQLRQQLARRDSAGGRRSQYGPREVELQAQLARLAGGMSPQIGQYQQQSAAAQAMMLRNLLQLGNQTGAFKGLADLFGG